MNRQIKFRVWDNQAKKMSTTFNPLVGEEPTIYGEAIYSRDAEYMQFTGLQDKNGKDIFEGDIISFETDTKGVVMWNNHVLCYTFFEDYKGDEITNSDFLWDWGQLTKGESKHYIVHGNIYENPELLKSQK